MKRYFTSLVASIFLLPIASSHVLSAQDSEPDAESDSLEDDLAGLSLEELMDVEVEIVSKKQESLARVPAAVTVLTGEDIRRSGAQTIPDILRGAVGVNVAQQNANYWAVSIRGFNDVFANKLLVMMDGRSVYSPLFSGTFWDVQDTVLADIERIEIVRGPGATVWGANAVNGVINIITKSAKDTQGSLGKVGFGSDLQGVVAGRHGFKLADDLFMRLYGKYANWDNLPRPTTGVSANDKYHTARGGFRMEWLPDEVTELTLQGEVYGGKVANTYNVPPTVFSPAAQANSGTPTPGLSGVGGGHLLARLEKDLGNDRILTIQSFYDRTVRQTVVFDETRDTGDVEAQLNLSVGDRHSVALGTGYRISGDDIGNLTINTVPQSRVTHLVSAFVQDDIELIPDRTRLSLGTKLEHNQFTGVEVQPSARISHVLADNQVVWASAARAVRTPSRVEDDVRLRSVVPTALPSPPFAPGGGFVPLTIFGSRNFDSEKMLAFEIGHRSAPAPGLTLEIATFYNRYTDLRSIEFTPVGLSAIGAGGNDIEGEAYGVELSPTIQLAEWWQLRPSYAFQKVDMRGVNGTTDPITAREEDQSPQHTLTVNSRMQLQHSVELDITARYVDQIFVPRSNFGGGTAIDSYWAMDVRVGWIPKPGWEVSLLGQSLMDASHQEFAPTFVSTRPAEVQHSIFAAVTRVF